MYSRYNDIVILKTKRKYTGAKMSDYRKVEDEEEKRRENKKLLEQKQ